MYEWWVRDQNVFISGPRAAEYSRFFQASKVQESSVNRLSEPVGEAGARGGENSLAREGGGKSRWVCVTKTSRHPPPRFYRLFTSLLCCHRLPTLTVAVTAAATTLPSRAASTLQEGLARWP